MPSTDLNLLFGMLALQLDFINRDQLLASMQAWVRNKAKPLGQILLGQGALDPDRLQLLDTLVQKHLEVHNNDAQQSLAALISRPSAREALERVDDADVQATLRIAKKGRERTPVAEFAPQDFATVAPMEVSPHRQVALKEIQLERANDPDSRARFLLEAEITGGFARVHQRIRGYELLGEIGRGGMGVVYKARDVKLKRIVALKVILSGAHAGTNELARFKDEAESIARLQHPNVVQVYEIGDHEGLPFLSLEFCAGGSLSKRLAGTPLLPHGAARLLQVLALAVHAAHGAKVIHRDLKPGNILLQTARSDAEPGETTVSNDLGAEPAATDWKSVTLKITDFGLAKKFDEVGHTNSGAVMGTPSYMPPEQASGKTKELGPRADIYSLGAILYELLTGRPPFKAATAVDTIMQVMSDDPVPPRQLQNTTPKDLETICLKCLRKEPSKRFSSAQELADELGRYLRGEPILSRPVGRIERALKWKRRNQRLFAALAFAAAALLLGTGFSLWFGIKFQRAYEGEAKQRQETAKEVTRFETMHYIDQIGAAQVSLQANDLATAEHQLNNCRWDLRHVEHVYLRKLLAQKLPRVLLGHDRVSSLSISADGDCVVSGSEDNTIKVWDLKTGLETLSLSGNAGRVIKLALSANEKKLFSMSAYKSIRVRDLDSGKEIELATNVFDMVAAPNGKRFYYLVGDSTIRVWDTETGQESASLRGHQAKVRSIALSPDGGYLYSGSDDATIKGWDLKTGTECLSLNGHLKSVIGLAVSGDAAHLASASVDAKIKVWDLKTGKERVTLPEYATELLISLDGKRLYSRQTTETFKVWNLANEKGQAVSSEGIIEASCLSLSRDSQWLVAATSFGRGIKIWKAKSEPVGGSAPWPAEVLLVSPDWSRLFARKEDKSIAVWDTNAGKEEMTLRGHEHRVKSAALSPNGKLLFSGSLVGRVTTPLNQDPGNLPVWLTGEIKVWDSNTGKELRSLRGHANEVDCLAVSPDGKLLFSGTRAREFKKGEIKIWDVESGEEKDSFPDDGVAMQFSMDGKRLFLVDSKGTIKSWDLEGGKDYFAGRGGRLPKATLGEHEGANNLRISTNGRWLFSGNGESIRIWDLEKAGPPIVLPDAAGAIHNAVLSVDGKRLFSGFCALAPAGDKLFWGGTVKVWDLEARKATLTLRGGMLNVWDFAPTVDDAFSLPDNGADVVSLALSADGKWLFTGSQDKTIQVWDMRTGKVLLTLSGHARDVTSLAVSLDRKRLYSGSGDTTIKVWDLETGREVRTLRGHASPVVTMVISTDGRTLYSASLGVDRDDKNDLKHKWTIKHWDLGSGNAKTFSLTSPISPQTGLAISPDGKRLFTNFQFDSTSHGAITMWNVATGAKIRDLGKHVLANSLAMSADGQRLFSLGSDGAIKVWEPNSGTDYAFTATGNAAQATTLAATRDGTRIISASGRRMNVWGVAPRRQ